jgi:predicted metal-dependent peptidase
VDTSGSMGAEELGSALGETTGVLRACGGDITFLACDAQVHEAKQVSNPKELAKLLKGGGGTSFRPVFDYVSQRMKEKPSLIIGITDGCGDVQAECPVPGADVIWVLCGPYAQRPIFAGKGSWGEFIWLDEDKEPESTK